MRVGIWQFILSMVVFGLSLILVSDSATPTGPIVAVCRGSCLDCRLPSNARIVSPIAATAWYNRLMSSAKEQMAQIIQEQPDDSSYDEILRELAFSRMIERGLADSDSGRTISNDEMARRISSWQG